jgi:hypothetical protein
MRWKPVLIVIVCGSLSFSLTCGLDDPAANGGDKLCGNGVIDPGEDCDKDKDGKFFFKIKQCHKGQLVCLDDCTTDPKGCLEYCGDGEANGTEECDGIEFNLACTAGKFTCDADCKVVGKGTTCTGWCGDGKVDKPKEQCEPKLGVPAGACYDGTATCKADCTIDFLNCNKFCGDEVVNGNELCDGAFFQTDPPCHDKTGALLCRPDCTIDAGTCTAYCGDGKKNGPAGVEECDGTDFGGTLPCPNAKCQLDCLTNCP